MNAPKDFLSSLVPGDLVAATVSSSAKLHLIYVVRRVTAEMCKGQPSEGALEQMFDGDVLCSVRPRYWWRPTDQMEAWQAENKCSACFAAWRNGGRPTIKGWATAEARVEAQVRLPWGWEQVAPQGHPWDLPEDAEEPEDEDHEGPERRKEVARWLRGQRYVRITQSFKDQRFCVRYGALDDKEKNEDWAFQGGWDNALTRAVVTMALGGTWSSSSNSDKLTLKGIGAI